MSLSTLHDVAWRRFHDARDSPIRPDVADAHCADDPKGLIELCAQRPPTQKFKAAGSHWALSEATLSDDAAVETNWPGVDNVPRNSGLALDLKELVNDRFVEFLLKNPPTPPALAQEDPCLNEGPSNAFYVHLKSGTRIYEAYSLLDRMDQEPTSLAVMLNEKLTGGSQGPYDGPWAFATMGGAGGQTVFGALTTGTHGGDYRQRPLSDAVAALHLITDGGDHFWIEPSRRRMEIPLTDDAKLHQAFDTLVPDARFDIIRDNDDIFDAAVVGVGRFGVVSSIVLRVVPQYCLLEHRRLDNWSNVKTILNGAAHHHAFDMPYFPITNPNSAEDRTEFQRRFGESSDGPNRFLQIALNVSPHQHDDHRCGVSQRWFFPSGAPEARNPDGALRGREERGTAATAGASHSYEPPDDAGGAGSSNGTFISKACADGNFIAGVLRELGKELEEAIVDGAVSTGGAIAAAIAVGAGGAVLAVAATLCAALVAIAEALKLLADAVDGMGDASLAQTVDTAVGGIRDIPGVPDSLKIMAIRTLLFKAFESQQSDRDMVALSYAVMDTHDYFDRSCFGNAESLEVFFDATRPDLYCAFVDQILAFEAAQEEQRFRFTVGYVSLRFMRGSHALIAPSQFPETVAIEVSGIRDSAGTIPFVMNAAAIARNPMYGALFHWGQFNPLTRVEVERLYGQAPTSRLQRWRTALQKLTKDGALDGFSSEFTRRTGLEPL